MRILFITTILPTKARSGGEYVSRLLLEKFISLGYEVDVWGYSRIGDSAEAPSYMHSVKDTVIESKTSKLFTIKNILKSFFCKRCYSCQKYISKEYADLLTNNLSEDISVIIIDHIQMGWILNLIPKDIKIIAVNHNVESDLYCRMSNENKSRILRFLYKREAKLLKRLERNVFGRADLLWTLSEENKERYIEMFPDIAKGKFRDICIPPSDESNASNANKKFDIGMIGSWSWDANNKGLLWFFNEVYPLIPASVKIGVAGIGVDWLCDKYTNVSYLGFVESANEFMNQSKAMAIPSISGDGIQIKTINYIGAGINTIATSFAIRGIGDIPSYIKISDKANDFSKQLLEAIKTSGNDNSEEAMEWRKKRNEKFSSEILNSMEKLSIEYAKKNMKVVYLMSGLSCSGGKERVVLIKANYLADKLGYDVYIISERGITSFFEISKKIALIDLDINYKKSHSSNFINRNLKNFFLKRQHKKLLERELLNIKADIVISTYDNSASFLHEIKDGSKKILEFHLSKYFFKYEKMVFLHKFLLLFREWYEYKFKIPKYDKFVVLTDDDKSEWKKHGIDATRIYNPISFKSEQTADLNSKIAISVGRLETQKNYSCLIEIWSKIYENFPEWKLHIFGSGSQEIMLKKQIVNLGLQNTAFIFPPEKDIKARYLESSIYLTTSCYEGFPLTLIETCECGLPAISFDIKCGPREIIKNGDSGYLIEFDNKKEFMEKIVKLIKNQDLRIKFGKNSKQKAKDLYLENIIPQWEKLFKEIYKNEEK